MIGLVFFLLAATVAEGWPGCAVTIGMQHSYENDRLLTSFVIAGGSIGGTYVEQAKLIRGFENNVRCVLPETWSDVQYDSNTSTITALAGCETRVLTGVVRSSEVTVPHVSIDGIVEYLGGSVAWAVGSERAFPGHHSWQQFLMRREGTAAATGCTLHTCVFQGIFAGHVVDVIFSLAIAGIGLPVGLARTCGKVTLRSEVDVAFDACHATRVCRGILCVQQTYVHGIENITGLSRPVNPDLLVVVGIDALELNRRNLALYFTANELRVGVLYFSHWNWQQETTSIFIALAMIFMIVIFVGRPLAFELTDHPTQQRVVVGMNTVGNTLAVAFMFYRTADIYDGVRRSVGSEPAIVSIFLLLTVGLVMVQYALCIYANFCLKPTSPKRNAIVRLFFSSLLCVTFIMHNCGATERDVQTLFAAFGALAWLHVIPRTLTALYISYGSVWVVVCGIVSQCALLPFVVVCGLVTAVDNIDAVNTSSFALATLLATLTIASGVYVGVSAAASIPIENMKKQ